MLEFLKMRGSNMENNLEVIPIFFAIDDGYMPFLAVALVAIRSFPPYFFLFAIVFFGPLRVRALFLVF